jgi:hypothetical protein
MSQSLTISCPVCERKTDMIHLKFPKATEKDIEIAKSNPDTLVWTELSPEQSRAFYKLLTTQIENNLPNVIFPTISRIKSHNLGLFKEKCSMSDKVFKVYHVIVLIHEKQMAQSTFRIGEEIHDFEK